MESKVQNIVIIEGYIGLGDAHIRYTKWTDAIGSNLHGSEMIAEKVDVLRRPKAAEYENPELAHPANEFPL